MALGDKHDEEREIEEEDRRRSERAERLGILADSGIQVDKGTRCARCGEAPPLPFSDLCDYCQQIWDHMD